TPILESRATRPHNRPRLAISGRQSPSFSGTAEPNSTPSSPVLASPSNTAATLDSILRAVQHLDGRMDILVGRVDRMEAWIPNLGADTSSDRDHDAASIADTDRDTITHLHPTRSSAAVTSSIDPTRDLPPHLTGNTPLRPTAAHHVDSGGPEAARAGAERAVSEHAASPTRPHRPDKAAGRSGTPHELKPPQVQAFRTLTSKEKAAIQRLSALLGRPVPSAPVSVHPHQSDSAPTTDHPS
ncbi:unnamed protein product, partial [Tilletia laevis]